MGKADFSVEDLVSMIKRGELRLPEMQRRYVWRATRVRDLLDSLYRGYPSGAILIWESDSGVPVQDFAVTQDANPYQKTLLLLDGQQRLTSLSAILRGESLRVRGRINPIDILFNLEHPDGLSFVTEVNEENDDDIIAEEDESNESEMEQRINQMAFIVATKKLANHPKWVSVKQVFQSNSDASFLTKAGVNDFNHPNYEKYSGRLKKLREIKDYMYRVDILDHKLSYTEVTEIFVRVNSLGAKLKSSDLALAQITSKWSNSLKMFDEAQKQFADRGFDLELGVLLKTLVACATGQASFQSVGGLSRDKLQEAWRETVEGLDFALNFMINEPKINSPALLSSPFILVVLAFMAKERNASFTPEESTELRRWVLLANAKGRWSRGSTDTLIDQDLQTIKQGGGARELLSRLASQVGRLSIEPSDLDGRNRRSALFKTMFLAFRDVGARDWRSNLTIALDHQGASHKLQFHHIFPKAKLRGKHTTSLINEAANLSFVSGKVNRQISDTGPSVYLRKVRDERGPEALALQCIPDDPAIWDIENYEAFLEGRKVLIANCLNKFLGTQ